MSCSISTTRDAGIGDPPQQLGEHRLVGVIQPRRGLVEHQDAGTQRERARDLQQALVDVREVAGEPLHAARVADVAQQRARLLRLRAGDALASSDSGEPSSPRCIATSRFSSTVIRSNSCGVWNVRRDAGARDAERRLAGELAVCPSRTEPVAGR